MKTLLAIETSDLYGSVAILTDGELIAEQKLPPPKKSAQTLAPAIKDVVSATKIDAIAVSYGPGSFTGLRVGVMTAKMLAYAWNIPVCGVNTLHAIAASCPQDGKILSVAIDAQRKEVVRQRYKDGKPIDAEAIVSLADWLSEDADFFASPLFEKDAIREAATKVLPPDFWHPKASAVGKIAFNGFGKFVSSIELLPVYSRLSAAEEKQSIHSA